MSRSCCPASRSSPRDAVEEPEHTPVARDPGDLHAGRCRERIQRDGDHGRTRPDRGDRLSRINEGVAVSPTASNASESGASETVAGVCRTVTPGRRAGRRRDRRGAVSRRCHQTGRIHGHDGGRARGPVDGRSRASGCRSGPAPRPRVGQCRPPQPSLPPRGGRKGVPACRFPMTNAPRRARKWVGCRSFVIDNLPCCSVVA